MATEETISFRTSKWKRFDPDFAEMIRTEHPDIWKLGGNIRGNDQYRKLHPIIKRNGVPNSQIEIDALKLREAWNARHYNDFRIAGVIAQVKWLAVGSRGEQYMKNLINEEIQKRSEIKQSDSLENHLAHYGKKGMRWGTRSGGATKSEKADAKLEKADTKWQQKRSKRATLSVSSTRNKAVAKEAIKNMGPDVKKLNKDPRFNTREAKKAIKKEKGYYEPKDEIAKAYNKEVSDIYMKHVKAAAKKQLQTSPSGKFKEKLTIGKDWWTVEVTPTDSLMQASNSDLSISFRSRPVFDEDGYIIDFEVLEDELMQSDSLENHLAHYGKKGMRWGVRSPGTHSSGKASKKTAKRTTYKKPPTKLSDAELQRRVRRLETEKKYIELNNSTKTSNKGKKATSKLLGQAGNVAISAVASAATGLAIKAAMNKVTA